jgi:phage terminase small subunit
MTIESMAGWWSIMKKSQKSIRDEGMIQTAESGWQQVTPAVNIFEKAWNKLKDFSDRYGFNLLSKDKITAPPPKDEKAEKLRRLAQ